MRDYRLYLKDILDAMESIEAFVTGMDSLGQTFCRCRTWKSRIH